MTWNWQWFVLPGSAVFVLPMTILVGIGVLLHDRAAWRSVLRWWSLMAMACALTATSKIAFYGWGTGIRVWNLTCFSGHTVLALAFWPVAMGLLVPATRPAIRRLLILAGWGIAVLIAISRVPLGAHPWSEVIAGAILGGGVGFIALLGLHGHHAGRWWPSAGALVFVAVASVDHGYSIPTTEHWFQQAGKHLSGNEKATSRKRWLRGISGVHQSDGMVKAAKNC